MTDTHVLSRSCSALWAGVGGAVVVGADVVDGATVVASRAAGAARDRGPPSRPTGHRRRRRARRGRGRRRLDNDELLVAGVRHLLAADRPHRQPDLAGHRLRRDVDGGGQPGDVSLHRVVVGEHGERQPIDLPGVLPRDIERVGVEHGGDEVERRLQLRRLFGRGAVVRAERRALDALGSLRLDGEAVHLAGAEAGDDVGQRRRVDGLQHRPGELPRVGGAADVVPGRVRHPPPREEDLRRPCWLGGRTSAVPPAGPCRARPRRCPAGAPARTPRARRPRAGWRGWRAWTGSASAGS